MKRLKDGTRFFVVQVVAAQSLGEAREIEEVLQRVPVPEGFEPYSVAHAFDLPTEVYGTFILEPESTPDWMGYETFKEKMITEIDTYFPHVVVKVGEARLSSVG